jgi:hypothetical protein
MHTRAPVLVYATATSVRLRAASGSVRVLARFAASGLPTELAWSPDGTKVAWLVDDRQKIGLTGVRGGPTRKWNCSCSAIAFAGDSLISDSYSGKPHLLRYPDSGKAPTSIPVSGLPKSGLPFAVFDLLTATPAGQLIAGYGTEVSAYGGPQLLYRVSDRGRATLFAPKSKQQTANTPPYGFAFSTHGTGMAFLLFGHGGFCANGNRVVVAKTRTGAESSPVLPRGSWLAAAVWFGPSGTAYTSLTRSPAPGSCQHNKVVRPKTFRLRAGHWVRAGTGTIAAAYTADDWAAVLTGRVTVTGEGIGQYSHARLTVSHDSRRFTIAGVTAFGWVP